MAARHLLIPFAGWHAEHDIDSDPNWRVQYGKGIYIEITVYIYIYKYTVYRDIPKNPKNQHLFHWHHMPVVPGIFQKHPHTGQGIFLPQAAT